MGSSNALGGPSSSQHWHVLAAHVAIDIVVGVAHEDCVQAFPAYPTMLSATVADTAAQQLLGCPWLKWTG